MTEDRATRASHAPCAPQGPASAPGADPAPGRASQGDTGLRERIAMAMLAHYIDPTITDPDGYDHCVCGSWASDNMSEGWDDHLADAVLPVVEVALAEQTQTLRAVEIDRDQWRDRATHWRQRAEVSDDPTAATYIGYLDRAENAEDRIRKAEADRDSQQRLAIRATLQRDDALAALTRHAAEAHRRKWAHEDGNQAAFDALHRLGDEILASRDRLIAALEPKETR